MVTIKEAREHLVSDLRGTADWRRRLATEQPADNRNIEAAEILDKLAGEVKNLDDAIFDAYTSLWSDYTHGEAHFEVLRSIGVSWHPETAGQLVKQFIAHRSIG
jgi:hypothetical protein